jgi:hypothetical protein
VVVGITQSISAQLGQIARAMPLDTTQYAKQQWLRRFLDNERITQADHYQPLLRAALRGLKGQKVQLLIDRVLLHDRHNILLVSIGKGVARESWPGKRSPMVGKAAWPISKPC